MKFLFKYPSFGRPEWFKQTLEKYYSMLSGKNEYQFVISLNTDDNTMNNKEMREFMDSKSNLKYYYDNHKSKIEAINADMDGLDFDLLFLISDDMIPVVPGFDVIISKKMIEHFPNIDGALHFNDDCCGKNECITLTIMGKKLYDRFGYIYHPDYKSFFCDNEFTDEVYRMKKAVYIPKVIVKHDWKGWGKDRDNTYKRNTQLGKDDEAVYSRRKKLGFPR